MDEDNIVTLQNFVGGIFKPVRKYLDSYNPATGIVLAKVPDSTENEVKEAVNAAKLAFPEWSSKPVEDRSKILLKVAEILEERLDGFAEAESMDQGKPLWLAHTVEIPRAVQNFRHFANSALCDFDKAIHQPNGDTINYTVHSPVGVAAIIVPWNLPLYLLTFKLAPALVYGNTVVVKPSELTSVTAWMLCSVLQEAGVPDGVVNVVFGYGATVGEALVNNPDVNLISFTGSTATGCHIGEIAAKSAKKISLEMGGKNAAAVFEDANLLKCVPALLKGSFMNQGQICLSTSRIYIQRKIFDVFVDMFVKETKLLKIGDPMDENTFLGPLCSKQHMEKVLFYLDLAKKEGAKFLTGGTNEEIELPEKNKYGYFVKPVVLTNLPDKSRCMQEEIFGPVTCLMPFDTEEEVISRINGTKYGLCASIWSHDIQRIHGISQKLDVGTVWCNCWLQRNLHMPFGGTKMSGTAREGTDDSREFYTTKKTVCVNYGD